MGSGLVTGKPEVMPPGWPDKCPGGPQRVIPTGSQTADSTEVKLAAWGGPPGTACWPPYPDASGHPVSSSSCGQLWSNVFAVVSRSYGPRFRRSASRKLHDKTVEDHRAILAKWVKDMSGGGVVPVSKRRSFWRL